MPDFRIVERRRTGEPRVNEATGCADEFRGAGGRSPLRLVASAARDICVLIVDGVLDDTTYIPLRDAVVEAALDEPRAVIVDVSGLMVPDAAAWGVFSSARWQVTEWPDTPIGLVCNHHHQGAVCCSGLAPYVPVYPTRQSALAGLTADGLRRYRRCARSALPGLKSSSQRCRALTAEWLTAWSRTDFIPAVSIVATELVEIALANTDGAVSLRLEADGSTVAVAVQYAGAAPPAAARHSISGTACGIDLVAATSRVWGSYTASAGHTVWAVLGPENRF
jgi:hypothetical protein